MNLTDIASSYLLQFPQGAAADIKRQERMLESFGRIAFGGFGLVILTAIGAIIYLIVTRMILSGTNFWSGILLVAFIIFAGLSLGYVFLQESIKEKSRNSIRDCWQASWGTPPPPRILARAVSSPR